MSVKVAKISSDIAAAPNGLAVAKVSTAIAASPNGLAMAKAFADVATVPAGNSLEVAKLYIEIAVMMPSRRGYARFM